MQRPHHIDSQFVFAAQQLAHSILAAEKRRNISRLELELLHPILESFNGSGGSDSPSAPGLKADEHASIVVCDVVITSHVLDEVESLEHGLESRIHHRLNQITLARPE